MSVLERFLRYVSFPTMSDETSDTCPSTEKQRAFGRALAEELREIGLSDVELDPDGYVYASLPAKDAAPPFTMGLIAHMDTSDAAPDGPVRARVVRYEGGDLCLNEERGIFLRPSESPSLNRYVGQRLIVTDGTTLLGADDKAGVCAIVSAAERALRSGRPRGAVRICFTPDEEIGRGADRFDVEKFGADFAYTLDGGALGELQYENFNAADATVTIQGASVHPGDAKGRMRNAQLMAMEFHALLPPGETPERTEGYEGFFHLHASRGTCETAVLRYLIRDHDRRRFEERKRVMERAAAELCRRYGDGSASVAFRDSYYNMREILEGRMETVERARRAMRAVGIEPVIRPIRGGTDGARLSFMGLPCPNLCTGGENFHSRFEYLPLESLERVVDMTERLILDAACGEAR